jgi:hypothetical protein
LFDRRGCLLALGACVFVAGVAYALALLACLALGSVLRGLLPPDALVAALTCVGVPLWGAFALAAARVLFVVRRRREAARRRQLEGREALTGEEFGRLFPGVAATVAAVVRKELERFVGRAEVVRRLLPSDPVRGTCERVDFCPDDLDWAEFLLGLEARFGGRLPDEAFREATVAELVTGCAGPGGRTT